MMNLDDAKEIINASAFASWKKQPHLVHMTVRLGMMPAFNLRDWMAHQSILLEKMRKWLVRNDVPVGFIWIREMGAKLGPHLHCLLHLKVQHWGALKAFLLDAGQFAPPDRTGEAIVLAGNTYGTWTPAQRSGHLCYLMKSLDPEIVARQSADDGGTALLMNLLGVDSRDEVRLPIVGKRAGVSHTWGPAARRAAGWRELRTPAELRMLLHP